MNFPPVSKNAACPIAAKDMERKSRGIVFEKGAIIHALRGVNKEQQMEV